MGNPLLSLQEFDVNPLMTVVCLSEDALTSKCCWWGCVCLCDRGATVLRGGSGFVLGLKAKWLSLGVIKLQSNGSDVLHFSKWKEIH